MEPTLLPGPEKDYCACGCGLFGTPKKNGHIARHCRCASCSGRRSRASGLLKQRAVRKKLGIEGPSLGADHEENWRGVVRVEVKSGHQVQPCATAFYKMLAQSEASRPWGDSRPFVGIAMPKDDSDGIVLIRLSELVEVALAIANDTNAR